MTEWQSGERDSVTEALTTTQRGVGQAGPTDQLIPRQTAARNSRPSANRPSARRRVSLRVAAHAITKTTTRILFWIAGADDQHIRGVKKERYFYQLLGFSVVLTACAAVIGMILFIRLSVPGDWPRDIAIASFWGILIFWVDRMLVSNVAYGRFDKDNDGHDPRGKAYYFGLAGRAFLAILLAFTISGPIILAIFSPEIDQQIVVDQNNDKTAASDALRNRPDFQDRRQQIDNSVRSAENIESDKIAEREAAQAALDEEISGRGGTGVPGCAQECIDKRRILDGATTAASDATAAAAATRTTAATQISALEKEIASATDKTDAAVDASTGVLARERALFEILFASPVLLLRWAAISGLLLVVDLMPIGLKMLTSTIHDRGVRRQAINEDLAANDGSATRRLSDSLATEVSQQAIRGNTKVELEGLELDLEHRQSLARLDNETRILRARLGANREIEEARLDHEVRLYTLRGRFAEEMRDAEKRYSDVLDKHAVRVPPDADRDPALAHNRQRSDERADGESEERTHAAPQGRRPGSGSLLNARWEFTRPLSGADVGAAGSVYLARDTRSSATPSSHFVVKLLRSFDGAHGEARRKRAEKQLKNEQRWASAIKSRFVAPIVDAGDDLKHGLFIVTPYYHSTVSRKLNEPDFEPTLEFALRIAEHALHGLTDCYTRAGLVHLDIKPANIALDEMGQCYLLDLGLARKLAAQANNPSGPPEGTRWYAPPEQLQGRGDWRRSSSDVRAVFAVVYEILTGWPPLFREAVEQGLVTRSGGENPARSQELWSLLISGTPQPVNELLPRLPLQVNDLVMRGLNRDPAVRAPGQHPLDAQNALDAVTALQKQIGQRGALNVGRKKAAPLVSDTVEDDDLTPPGGRNFPPRGATMDDGVFPDDDSPNGGSV